MGKYQDFVAISLDWIIVEGYCRWKLSSGNLYTFAYRQCAKLEKQCALLLFGPLTFYFVT